MTKAIALATASVGSALAGPAEAGSDGVAVRGRPKMEKAKLTLYDPSPDRNGGGRKGAERGSIAFQFNPKEVSITKSATWQRKTTRGSKTAGPPEFTGSEPCKLTMEMFFDATNSSDGSVVAAVESLMACCVPTEESINAKKPSPPLVVLHWGHTSSFPAYVKSVAAKYTLFRADGSPLRATCNVELNEMPGEVWRQNPTSGSDSVRRVHRVVAGDTLASVAYAEYGDPARWRALASYNGIDDPMRVRSGTSLLVPTPEELAGSG